MSQHNSKTTKANLTKLHRKIKHHERVCRAQGLGSFAQGQGHVKGQIVPKIVLPINCRSEFDETLQKDKVLKRTRVAHMVKVPSPEIKLAVRSEVKIASQQ